MAVTDVIFHKMFNKILTLTTNEKYFLKVFFKNELSGKLLSNLSLRASKSFNLLKIPLEISAMYS